jgi:hypothetical protein
MALIVVAVGALVGGRGARRDQAIVGVVAIDIGRGAGQGVLGEVPAGAAGKSNALSEFVTASSFDFSVSTIQNDCVVRNDQLVVVFDATRHIAHVG